ncbi:MAG: aminotransferase class I/II-fold pyridoxal phosphate-dependent enzyme [Chloroflexota bacterium]|nr:aminotransferase class I/II-fold pyridoxal phosphate-dependent enzyme [Chloroflexota bacterium]
MNIEPFTLERWMTRWELHVDFDIDESGILPLSLRQVLDLLPTDVAAETTRYIHETPLGYSEARGTARLRSVLASTYARAQPDDVLVTTGAIEANFLLFHALVSPGDHVVAVTPAYQQLNSVPRAIGADVSLWDVRSPHGFRYDLDLLESLLRPNTRLIVINSPHNPTGAMLDEADLKRIVELADRSGAWILSDEAYRWLEHPGGRPLPPPLHDLSDRAISVGTMSKSFGLPGLRVGWFAANADIAATAWGLRDYISLSPAKVSDAIAAAVIEHRDRFLPRNAAIIAENLAFAREWFTSHADLATWNEPHAGLLAMMRYTADMGSSELADDLARNSRVMLAPGSSFGLEGYLRIGIGQRPDIFAEGLRRTAEHLSRLPVTAGVE